MNGRAPLWSTTDYLLADVYDGVNAVAWLTANKDVPKNKQSEQPKPYPRPGVESRPKKTITGAALLEHAKRTRKG